MSHTKEPWSFSPENGLEWGVEAGKWGVAICADAPGDGTSEANARRIVACVNACAGISTDALEIGRMSPDAFHENESRADKAEQQRDELLAALEHILAGSLSLPRFAEEQARSAIASVKASTP